MTDKEKAERYDALMIAMRQKKEQLERYSFECPETHGVRKGWQDEEGIQDIRI